MIGQLRTPFLYAAFLVMLVVFLTETSSAVFLKVLNDNVERDAAAIEEMLPSDDPLSTDLETNKGKINDIARESSAPPGLAISYLAVLDALLLFRAGVMVASTVVSQRVQSRVIGFLDGGLSFVGGVIAIGLIIVAVNSLLMMVALLLAVPSGTLVYLAKFGFFDRGSASLILSITFGLKIGFLILLVFAHQSFLKNIPLLLLIGSSLMGNVVISLLHGLFPGFLVSITDAIAAIIVGICSLGWLVLVLIGALPAMAKALKPPLV